MNRNYLSTKFSIMLTYKNLKHINCINGSVFLTKLLNHVMNIKLYTPVYHTSEGAETFMVLHQLRILEILENSIGDLQKYCYR